MKRSNTYTTINVSYQVLHLLFLIKKPENFYVGKIILSMHPNVTKPFSTIASNVSISSVMSS